MTRATGRRRITCYHEAAHALVRWYFGHMTDRAVVLTVEDVRAGRTIENRRGVEHRCEGLVDGYDIHSWPYVPILSTGSAEHSALAVRDAEISRDIELMNCAAGIAAEAAYSRRSTLACAYEGGDGDLKHAREIRAAWYPDETENTAAAFLAERRAVALVRSAPGSAAIKAMAVSLMEHGEISGNEIASLCRSAYGGRECAFGAWGTCWPPTLAQIRSGYIPIWQAAAA